MEIFLQELCCGPHFKGFIHILCVDKEDFYVDLISFLWISLAQIFFTCHYSAVTFRTPFNSSNQHLPNSMSRQITFCFQTQSLKVIKSCHKSINRANFDWKSGRKNCASEKGQKKTLSMNELIIFHSVITLQTEQRQKTSQLDYWKKTVSGSLLDR